MKQCINCDNTLKESDKFCSECGQTTDDKLNLRVLFSNIIGNYLSIDARFFKTIIPLIFKPGLVAKSYINGKRKTYLHPGKTYLFISVIFFFFLSIKTSSFRSEINESIYEGLSQKSKTELDSVFKSSLLDITSDYSNNDSIPIDSLDSISTVKLNNPDTIAENNSDNFFLKQLDKIVTKKGLNLFDLFFGMISIAIFLLVPIYALFLKLLFYKPYNFTEQLVFSLYLFAFNFILAILYLSFYTLDGNNYIRNFILLASFIHITISIKNFYNKTIFQSIAKSLIQTSIFILILVPTILILLTISSIYLY